jgi:hypothetical protein
MTGVLAFYDSFTGMLPCTAISRVRPASGSHYHNGYRIKLRINTTRGGYTKGDVIVTSALFVVPRASYHRSRRGVSYYYTTPYNWQTLLPAEYPE